MVTMPVRHARARRMPPAARREALIDATLPLVLWHGPSVTTRQIAEAAAVAEGTIFRVFEGKEALIRAVTERAFDPAPALAEIAEIDPALPLRDRLIRLVVILQSRLDTVFRLIHALGMKGPPPDGHGRSSSTTSSGRRSSSWWATTGPGCGCRRSSWRPRCGCSCSRRPIR